MKSIILAVMLPFCGNAFAQINHVSLQASGLTCSMCSNSINKALKSLDYVREVKPDISTSTFEISFRPGAKVDFDQLKKKVEDAGFHVAKLSAIVNFKGEEIAPDTHLVINGTVFHFLNVSPQTLNGDKTIRVLDKGFVSSKEFKRNGTYTKMECYHTGVAGSCCSSQSLTSTTRIFHVTI